MKVLDIQFLNECINFEIRTGGKVCSFVCLYRSPSPTRDILGSFTDNFELTLDTLINKNPFLNIALDDFNAKTTNWYKNDINSYEGWKIDTNASQTLPSAYLHLMMESSVHSSFHPNCHHYLM